MLEFARGKAQASGLDNIRFCQGGFLGCHEDKPPVDAVVTQFAMHHLPDFWKEAALRRIAKMLKPNGKLFLNDVIFSFPFSSTPIDLPDGSTPYRRIHRRTRGATYLVSTVHKGG